MSPIPDDALPEMEMAPIGWIHGREILAGGARGARVHELRKARAPSEEALGWRVEEERLGRKDGWELRAWICTRKSGMFSTEREAALAYVRTGADGSLEVAPCHGALPDKGGSWIPQSTVFEAAREPSEALGEAMRAILGLDEKALEELEEAVRALRMAKAAQAGASELLAKALEGPGTGEAEGALDGAQEMASESACPSCAALEEAREEQGELPREEHGIHAEHPQDAAELCLEIQRGAAPEATSRDNSR